MTTNLRSNPNIPFIDVLSSSPTLEESRITENLKPIRDQDSRRNNINDTYDTIALRTSNSENEGFVGPSDYNHLIQGNNDLIHNFNNLNNRIDQIDDRDINSKNQAYITAITDKITSLAQRLTSIQSNNTKFMKNIKIRIKVILNRIYQVHVNINSINNNRTLINDLRTQITNLTNERTTLTDQLTQAVNARQNAINESTRLRTGLDEATQTIARNNTEITTLRNDINKYTLYSTEHV